MKIPALIRPIHREYSHSTSTKRREVRLSSISYAAGWNSAANSNVHAYTTNQAQQVLEAYSDALSSAINSSRCNIRVTKGCHQPNDPHFTIEETARNCNQDLWAGTRNVHVPC